MAENVSIDIKLNAGSAEKTIGELKQEFGDLKKEIAGTVAGTKEYAAAASRLAEVKASMTDLREEMRLLDPGEHARAFANLGTAMVGAFSIGAGAVGLFGAKNEELEKTLVRVQSAMAVLQGIQSLSEAKRSLEIVKYIALQKATLIQTNLQTASESKNVIVKGSATAAQWALNLAMSANPIGAVVVALTALIGALVLFSDTAKEAKEAQENINRINDIHEAQLKALAIQYQTNTKLRLQQIKNELAVLEAQGASEEAVYKKKIELLYEERRGLIALKEARADFKLTVDESMRLIDIENELKVISIKHNKDLSDSTKKAAEEKKKAAKEEREREQKRRADILGEDPELQLIDRQREAARAAQQEWEESLNNRIQGSQREFETIINYEERKRDVREQALIDATTITGSLSALNKGLYDAEIRLAGGNEAKKEEIRKRFARREKALAIANVAINTAQSISKVAGQTGVLAPFLIPAFVAIGAAQIASILAQNVENPGGGGSVSAPSTGGGGNIDTSKGVQFNSGNSQTTTGVGNRDEINNANSGTVRVFVVESDITSSQQRVNNIQQRATIE